VTDPPGGLSATQSRLSAAYAPGLPPTGGENRCFHRWDSRATAH
jgi:hypothetical protein